jgi:regulator of RNase E activity RraA
MTADLKPIGVGLPLHGPKPDPIPAELVERLANVSSATASAKLHLIGIRHAFIDGPQLLNEGEHHLVGRAITLQFMPQREDVASGLGQENAEKRSALWAVLDEIEPGDVLVVQAFGDLTTGCLGEMLLTYLKSRGGLAAVVDGCIRDWPKVRKIGLPVWARGVTPNYASQRGLFPWAYHCPVACGGALVLPGDVIVADGDGAVVIPRQLASAVTEQTEAHESWEEFSRMKLQEGGALQTYYPLDEKGQLEYEEWRRTRSSAADLSIHQSKAEKG